MTGLGQVRWLWPASATSHLGREFRDPLRFDFREKDFRGVSSGFADDGMWGVRESELLEVSDLGYFRSL